MYATPQANGISVSWEEIPAHQQRGCITGYRLYLQKKDGRAAPDVYGRYLVKTDVIRMCRGWRVEGREGETPPKNSVWSRSHRAAARAGSRIQPAPSATDPSKLV